MGSELLLQRFPALFAAAGSLPPGGVLYYALGGGWGHLTRASAIARQFRRLSSAPFAILTNSPAAFPAEAPLLRLDPATRLDAEELCNLIIALMELVRPAVLAVDSFPAGILGELAELLPRLPCRRAAVLRLLQPAWVARWQLTALLPVYNLIVLAERGAAFAGFPDCRSVETAPILIRDAEELLTTVEARRRLGHDGARPLVCVAATAGQQDEALACLVGKIVERLPAPGADLRILSPRGSRPSAPGPKPSAFWPLIEVMPGIDLLIGACGYNLFHEAAATGVPAVFVPQPRRYDDQFIRATQGLSARSPEELETVIRNILNEAAAIDARSIAPRGRRARTGLPSTNRPAASVPVGEGDKDRTSGDREGTFAAGRDEDARFQEGGGEHDAHEGSHENAGYRGSGCEHDGHEGLCYGHGTAGAAAYGNGAREAARLLADLLS